MRRASYCTLELLFHLLECCFPAADLSAGIAPWMSELLLLLAVHSTRRCTCSMSVFPDLAYPFRSGRAPGKLPDSSLAPSFKRPSLQQTHLPAAARYGLIDGEPLVVLFLLAAPMPLPSSPLISPSPAAMRPTPISSIRTSSVNLSAGQRRVSFYGESQSLLGCPHPRTRRRAVIGRLS